MKGLLIVGVTGFIVGGPLGAVGSTTVGLIMAYQFERKIWKRVREVIIVLLILLSSPSIQCVILYK